MAFPDALAKFPILASSKNCDGYNVVAISRASPKDVMPSATIRQRLGSSSNSLDRLPPTKNLPKAPIPSFTIHFIAAADAATPKGLELMPTACSRLDVVSEWLRFPVMCVGILHSWYSM